MDVRNATINDVPILVPLMEQLGYPTSVEKFAIKQKVNKVPFQLFE
ncbi:hypothetical protein M3182_19010 [Mesobacillus maritimus]|nr:hypothetical protein [Mesobacillus maritimus]MCM3587818.1 hypothetical protein [Mesobacillus maritimus]MCM3672208.1 hypothetical protein [Mesobacillus maritimus]